MKKYKVSYYLGDMYHCYTLEAENEYYAISHTINTIPDTSRYLFHDLKIELAKEEW